MGSFQNPISGGPRDPFEKPIRIEPIGDEHITKDKPSAPPDKELSQENLNIAAFLLQTFHKAINFFLEISGSSKSTGTDAVQNLTLLKASFEIMKSENRSQDAQFLNQLSKIWNSVLEESIHFEKNSETAERFKILIKKIQHFPENQQHTFGYYLSEYAGQKWVPFPYMELVAKIHKEHERNPQSSTLTEWTTLIDEIVQLLRTR